MVVARATEHRRYDLNLGFCYVCIGSCQDDQKFAIFNDPKFGPWAQIMTEVVDTRSPQKSYRIVSYFGGRIGSDTGRTSKVTWLEALGAYYRRYEFQSSPSIWGASVSLNYPLYIALFIAWKSLFHLKLGEPECGFEVIAPTSKSNLQRSVPS